MRVGVAVVVGLAGAVTALPAAGDVIELGALRDTTIYESPTGSLSGGASDSLYVGQNRTGNLRRGLLTFDLSSIPAGSTINSVTLELCMLQTTSGPSNITAHRVAADWGEAGSNGGGMGATAQPGDATWLHRFYNTTNWATPGGDFVGAASASTSVDQAGFYTWSGAGMVADVQAWIDGSAGNFGWILIGNEVLEQTAKRFGSREAFDPDARPVLTIDYTPVPGPTAAATILFGAALAGARRRR